MQPIPPTVSSNDSVVFSTNKNSGGNKKLIFAAVGVLLLMFGLISALVLSGQTQRFFSSAWDCQNYAFTVSQAGVVTVKNNSTRNEPLQKADVFIDSAKVASYDVPALNAGEGATLGTVTVTNGFSWEVRGTTDCSSSGRYDTFSAQCSGIAVYDTNWVKVDDLTTLKEGDVVNIVVFGDATSGTFTKARFTINGTLQPETTLVRPGSTEYYMDYTIPAGTTTFTINAQLFHDTLNQWI